MACEARCYDQNGTVAENSLVRHSYKDSKEAVGKLKEKKSHKGPLAMARSFGVMSA